MPATARVACPSPDDGQTLTVTNPTVALGDLMEFKCCVDANCSVAAPLVEFALIPEASGTSMMIAGCIALALLRRQR